MLNLQPRIHLKERHALGADEELDGGEAATGHRAHQPTGGIVQKLANRAVEVERGPDLEELLAAPLHAAVPVAEHLHLLAVSEHLHFNVPHAGQQFLEEHSVVAEGRRGFRPAAPERLAEVVVGPHRPHATTAAARARLHHDGSPGRK